MLTISALLVIGLVLVLAASSGIAGPEDNNKALIEAAGEGDLQEVERLLNSGADVNAADDYGWTALMRAVSRDHLNMVRLLLDKGLTLMQRRVTA